MHRDKASTCVNNQYVLTGRKRGLRIVTFFRALKRAKKQTNVACYNSCLWCVADVSHEDMVIERNHQKQIPCPINRLSKLSTLYWT